jgi:Ulp1 family protease
MKDPWQFDHKNLADRLHETLPQENGMKDCKVVSSIFTQLFDVHTLMYDLQNWFVWQIFLSTTVITNSFHSHHFCMQLMVPILDSGHWVLFVIDDLLGHVLIFDSNPYKLLGTNP